MSTISGYPIGSKITADLYKKGLIGDAELTKCAIISSTSGPIFVIGAVGGAMLKSPLCGVIIYLSNIVAVVISMVLINLFSKRKNLDIPRAPEVKERTKTPLYKLVSDIVVSLLIVGFYIALFSLLIDLLNDLHILSALSTMSDNILGVFGVKAGYSSGIMSGIVEMTNGAKALSFEISPLSVSLISFVIGFSGLSIIMQSLSFLSETKIKTRHFIGAKLLHGTLTFLICLALTSLIL